MTPQDKVREAQQAWENNGCGTYLLGVTDFKQSIKKTLEERLKSHEANRDKELEGTIPYWAGELIVQEASAILEILEIVKPI